MKIELKNVMIRDVVDGYANNNEEGVVGYGERFAANRLIEEDKNKGA